MVLMRRRPEDWGAYVTEGTWDEQVVDELAPAPGEPVVRKQRYSGFAGTSLDHVLKTLGAKYLLYMRRRHQRLRGDHAPGRLLPGLLAHPRGGRLLLAVPAGGRRGRRLERGEPVRLGHQHRRRADGGGRVAGGGTDYGGAHERGRRHQGPARRARLPGGRARPAGRHRRAGRPVPRAGRRLPARGRRHARGAAHPGRPGHALPPRQGLRHAGRDRRARQPRCARRCCSTATPERLAFELLDALNHPVPAGRRCPRPRRRARRSSSGRRSTCARCIPAPTSTTPRRRALLQHGRCCAPRTRRPASPT